MICFYFQHCASNCIFDYCPQIYCRTLPEHGSDHANAGPHTKIKNEASAANKIVMQRISNSMPGASAENIMAGESCQNIKFHNHTMVTNTEIQSGAALQIYEKSIPQIRKHRGESRKYMDPKIHENALAPPAVFRGKRQKNKRISFYYQHLPGQAPHSIFDSPVWLCKVFREHSMMSFL